MNGAEEPALECIVSQAEQSVITHTQAGQLAMVVDSLLPSATTPDAVEMLTVVPFPPMEPGCRWNEVHVICTQALLEEAIGEVCMNMDDDDD